MLFRINRKNTIITYDFIFNKNVYMCKNVLLKLKTLESRHDKETFCPVENDIHISANQITFY